MDCITTSSVVFLLLALRFCIWLDDHSGPAHEAWKRQQRVWRAEDRERRQRNRVARRALQRRFHAVARRYFTVSFVHYCQFIRRAQRCKTDAAFNRYVTLAEQSWADKTLP